MLRQVLLHNTALMLPRLIPALALSLALHGALILPDILKRLAVAPPRPALQASLRLPPRPEALPEPLLKNTLDPEDKAPEIKKPPPPVPPLPSKAIAKREVQAAQWKLSKYIFYPETARQQGLEGTVQLFVELSVDGSVEDVRVITSSGHAVLDNAAIKGFYAVGKLPGKSNMWYYTFRLVP